MERSIRFNNAGIAVLRLGMHEAAHELLRGALETKLAYDRAQIEQQLNPQRHVRSVSPECISTAEEHLANLPSYLSGSRPASETSDGERKPDQDPPSLYIYDEGFVMPEASASTIQLRSSINVFNLGLVHQLKDKRAEKAKDFYKIAATLLVLETGDLPSTEMIRIAVTNNHGVWCNDNQDPQEARHCMQHLANLLAHFRGELSPNFDQGLRSNLRSFGL